MKEYTVLSSQRWGGREKGKQDDDGSYMHSITVEGYTNEPIDFKSKEFPEVGTVLKGEIVPYTSNAGNERLRFETAEYKKKENMVQDRIMFQFALRLAVDNIPDYTNKEELIGTAEYFIECIKELTKNYGE